MYSKEFFNTGTLNVCLIPKIVLDSQVAPYFHQFVSNTDNARRSKPLKILNLLVKLNINYNYSFYVLESLCKLKGADTTPNYRQRRKHTLLTYNDCLKNAVSRAALDLF